VISRLGVVVVIATFLGMVAGDPANCSGRIHTDLISLFSQHTFKYDKETYGYRLFEPSSADEPGKHQPLIVWLHGQGAIGDDNTEQLKFLDRLVFHPPRKRERFPFFFLAVQCSSSQSEWFRPFSTEGDMLEVVHAIVQELLATKQIDVDRVYLTGISSGGTASWDLAWRYPKTFAAVLPLGSSGTYTTGISRLKDVPIWAFHCANDSGAPISYVQNTVNALKRAGGNVELTILPSNDHDAWTSAFRDYHALDWLMTQRRGRYFRAGAIPVGTKLRHALAGWSPWQFVIQLAVILSLAWIAWKALLWYLSDIDRPSPSRRQLSRR
jgi:predicted peptidase